MLLGLLRLLEEQASQPPQYLQYSKLAGTWYLARYLGT